MNFQDYLLSKKIDSDAFRTAESDLWEAWKSEFEHTSPVSFTAQKLFLINPIRRKYQAKIQEKTLPPTEILEPNPTKEDKQEKIELKQEEPEKKVVANKPVVPRPVFKPKPKTTD